MGGPGVGHKSVRARQARLVNIQKARAARKRAPLPWRSGIESRIIEQMVYQWWMTTARGQKMQQQVPAMAGKPHHHPATLTRGPLAAAPAGWVPFLRQGGRDQSTKNGGQWPAFTMSPLRRGEQVNSGQKGEMQIPRRDAPRNGNSKGKAASSSDGNRIGIREADRRTPYQRKPWAKLRVARFLGVSHTWVNKLVKKFEADPERMRRKLAAFAPASIEKLERAREETRWEREHGRLREPIRRRRVKVTIQGKRQPVVAVTRVERQRRQEQVESERARLRGYGGVPTLCTERKGWGTQLPVAYREVPEWAKGLLQPGDAALRQAQGQPYGLSAATRSGRTPRPVPFAFRRRR